MKLWTEASLNSEAKSDLKDIVSRTDFSAKEQFHRFGNRGNGGKCPTMPGEQGKLQGKKEELKCQLNLNNEVKPNSAKCRGLLTMKRTRGAKPLVTKA